MPVHVAHADDSLLIREGLEQILESEPGIELVEGIRVATRLRETAPELGVLVLSQYSNPGYALAAGGSTMDPKIVDFLLVQARLRRVASPLVALPPRELDVLAGIAQGTSNAAIAESLMLTKRAVGSTSTRSCRSSAWRSRRTSASG
jgi:hypothetical protein